jgi:hypothetical protein
MIILPAYAPVTGTGGIAIGQFSSSGPVSGQAVFCTNAIVFDDQIRDSRAG